MSSFLNLSFEDTAIKTNMTANNNTTYGRKNTVKGRKRLRLGANNTVCGIAIRSPFSKFRHNSSSPLPESVSEPVEDTPKKTDDSRRTSGFRKFFKNITSSIKKKNRPSADRSIKVGESNELNKSSVRTVRFSVSPHQGASQIYEKSINKHGDEVEYAVPYSELQSPMDAINDSTAVQCENTINENILDDSIDALGSMFTTTDLDKSSVGYMSLNRIGKEIKDSNNRDVLSELDALERWSQNISKRSVLKQKVPVREENSIIKCYDREIKPHRTVLRNTFALPLHFSSGLFRKAPVALRKCYPRHSAAIALVEEAIERDYEILYKVRHPNIILLMAVSFQKESLEHMTLVLEPVAFTLNYCLHQMDTTMSLFEAISVVQQIARAASYLQECGYIHSNISSHNILVGQNLWCVKLSSFELTTEVDCSATKAQLLIERHHETSSFFQSTDTPKHATAELADVSLKDQYRRMSKKFPNLKCSPKTQYKHLSISSKHMIYDTNYREQLSLHNFQAPELITTKTQFVFPTTKSDVYSLCLLLWEILNNCVPFVVYGKVDMERQIESNKLKLPFFEPERCEPFKYVLETGLALNPQHRTMDVQQLIAMLADVKLRIGTGTTDLDKKEGIQQNHFDSSTHSLNSMIFNQRLIGNVRQSTPRKFNKKKVFRPLFENSKEEVNNTLCESLLCQQSDFFETLASEIRSEQSLEFECNELPSNNLMRKQANRHNRSASSKSCSNLMFDAPTYKSRDRSFQSNIVSAPRHSGFNIGKYTLPDTPIARKNKIRRNAWLSSKSLNLSTKKIDKLAMEKKAKSLNAGNQQISIRIVHNRVTPKKDDIRNPLVTPRMNILDPNTKSSFTKKSNNDRVDDIDLNCSANYPIKDSSRKKLVELATVTTNSLSVGNHFTPSRSTERNRILSNCSTTQNGSTVAQADRCFENKFRKGELSICNRTHDSDVHANDITPEWQSVRDIILKFEKHGAMPSKSVRLTKSVNSTPSNVKRLTDAPTTTVITRTIYSESTVKVSGVDLASLDNQKPLFDQLDVAGEKLTTRVTLNMRQVRRRSFDDVDRPKIVDGRHTVCGSRKGLISFYTEASKDGSSGGKIKYICSDCSTKMSPDELRDLSFESVAENSPNATNVATSSQRTPQRCCQVRVKSQDTSRSIEDLYIDDDFDQGPVLGANIELHSCSSDFLNFDNMSDIFNRDTMNTTAQ